MDRIRLSRDIYITEHYYQMMWIWLFLAENCQSYKHQNDVMWDLNFIRDEVNNDALIYLWVLIRQQ